MLAVALSTFLGFAVIALRRNEPRELAAEAQEVAQASRRQVSPWASSFLVVFVAEWGDLTQLATVALVAHTAQPIPVALGAIAALWSVTVVAVAAGSRLGRLLAHETLNRVSPVLFAGVGLIIIGSTLAS